MKTQLTTTIMAVALLWGTAAWATEVGPDDFGYVAADQNEDDVDYAWIDMSGGTELTMTDDDVSAAVPLGFTFNFYGQDYTDVYVISNGLLMFEAPVGYEFFSGAQCPMPAPGAVDGLIGFYHRDFNPGDSACGDDCHIYHATGGTEPNRWFGVTYDAVPVWHEPTEPADPVTVQVLLYEGTNEVKIQVAESGLYTGSDSTIGIEAADGIAGLSWPGCLSEGSITDDMAVMFTPGTGGTPIVPPAKFGYDLPGESVDFEFFAFNLEADEVVFDLTAGGNTWTTAIDPTTVTLAAGGNDSFTVTVDIPGDAEGGDADEATITLTPQGGGDALTVTTTTLVQDAADAWQTVTDMPVLLDSPVAVGLGTELWLFSGTMYDALAAQYFVTDFIQVLNLDGDVMEWTYSYLCKDGAAWDHDQTCCADESGICSNPEDGAYPPLPDARAGATGCAMNGNVYIVGGQGVDAEGGFIADTIFIYDSVANSWSVGAAMPEARMSAAVVCDPGRETVFVISGGGPPDGEGNSEPTASLYAYDAAGNTWDATLAQPEGTRSSHTAELIDADTILVAGGYYDGFASTRTDLYDIADDAWERTGDLPFERVLHGSAMLDGRMCVFSGASWAGGAHADDDTYDCYSDGYWIPQLALLNDGRTQVAGATMDGVIYAVGGVLYAEEGYVQEASIERYPTGDLPEQPPEPEPGPEPAPDAAAEMAPDAGTADMGSDAGSIGTPDRGRTDGGTTDGTGGDGDDESGCCSVAGVHHPTRAALTLCLFLGLAVLIRRRR